MNSKNVHPRADLDPVYELAAEWTIRLRDPQVSPEEILAWQAWMRESPAHAAAFRRMEDLNETIADLRSAHPHPTLPASRELARDAYDGSTPIHEWQGHRKQLTPRWALAAGALVAAVALSVFVARESTRPAHGAAYTVSAPIGANRTVRLADGSTVTLGGDSAIAVDFSRSERHITLLRGEALFNVVKDPSRPLRVLLDRAVIVDVGTKFDVSRRANRVVIDVLEGRVSVVPRWATGRHPSSGRFSPKPAPVTVSAGESTSVDVKGIQPVSKISDLRDVTAWTSGYLIFRMQSLGQVLQDVNRYSTKPIVITTPAIADIKITSTVSERDVTGWVRSLHSALGIAVVDAPHRILLRRAR